MSYIYGLKLENNKYYVGKTNNPEVRIDQHVDGIGAEWTSYYKPIEVLFVKPSTTPFDEDLQVKLLMAKYGIHNVRGGTYCTKVLSDAAMQTLIKELRSASDLCLCCGSNEHFVVNCPKKQKIKKTKSKNVCKRCGRNTHTAENCYATTKLNGKAIKSVTCSLCQKTGHNKSHCPNQVVLK